MIKGIGKKHRQLLVIVLGMTQGYINVQLVQKSLNISKPMARTYLSRWSKNGWIKRIKRGTYIPIEIETKDLSLPIEDPWVVSQALFAPCYIGGWSAAQYWDLTDQIFNDTIVFTSKQIRHLHHKVGSHQFIVKRISPNRMFGMETVWKNNLKVFVSDPHKTLIDMLSEPSTGGGIRSVLDFFKQYLQSSLKDLSLLVKYAERMNNRTIFKRMGYLLSIIGWEDETLAAHCLQKISKGYSQLDPTAAGTTLVKKWRIFVPEGFHLESSK